MGYYAVTTYFAYFVLQQLLCEWPSVLWYRSPSSCGTSLGKYHGPPSEARLPPTTPKQGQAYHLPWFCQSLELCGCKTGNTWTFHFLFLGTTNWFNSLKGTILKLLTRRSHIHPHGGRGSYREVLHPFLFVCVCVFSRKCFPLLHCHFLHYTELSAELVFSIFAVNFDSLTSTRAIKQSNNSIIVR